MNVRDKKTAIRMSDFIKKKTIDWPGESKSLELLLHASDNMCGEVFCELVEDCPYINKWISLYEEVRRNVDIKLIIEIERRKIFDSVFIHSFDLYNFRLRKSLYKTILNFVASFDHYSKLVKIVHNRVEKIDKVLGSPQFFSIETAVYELPENKERILRIGRDGYFSSLEIPMEEIIPIKITKTCNQIFRAKILKRNASTKDVEEVLDCILLLLSCI